VLVVDDDVSVRDSVSEILRADGAVVTAVGNGREAIERLRRERFDVVLSDVVMPEMDGYELFQAARREAPDTPIVLMTAFYYDQDHVIKRSRMEGLDGVLFKKPVNPERLVKTLAELVTRARPRPS
jgi:CheY-like chemotaxis protein